MAFLEDYWNGTCEKHHPFQQTAIQFFCTRLQGRAKCTLRAETWTSRHRNYKSPNCQRAPGRTWAPGRTSTHETHLPRAFVYSSEWEAFPGDSPPGPPVCSRCNHSHLTRINVYTCSWLHLSCYMRTGYCYSILPSSWPSPSHLPVGEAQGYLI